MKKICQTNKSNLKLTVYVHSKARVPLFQGQLPVGVQIAISPQISCADLFPRELFDLDAKAFEFAFSEEAVPGKTMTFD